MAKQYVYNAIPVEQAYDQNKILYQYQSGSNPLDYLGLQGAQYTFVDESKNSNKTQKKTIYPTTAYTTNVKQQAPQATTVNKFPKQRQFQHGK